MTRIVYFCFLLSGTTGLIYQVLWGKYFALFIGVTAYAHTIVLATFMGGLALGNIIFGRMVDRKSHPLSIYALLELGIGIYAAFFPYLLDTVSRVYLAVAVVDPTSPRNTALKIFFSCLLLLPPTILMGGTLPALVRFIVRKLPELGRALGSLYFVNSAGAAAGCLIAGFYLIASFGLDASIMIASTVNIAIGLLFWFLRKHQGIIHFDIPDSTTPSESPLYSSCRSNILLLLVFASGAVSMLYELVWIRLLSLILGSSTLSFSIMLFTFIFGIAIGGLLSTLLLRRRENALLLFGIAELGVFAFMLLSVPVYESLPHWFGRISLLLARTEDAFGLYHTIQIILCFTAMFIPTVCMGISLPVICTAFTDSIGTAGRKVGTTFSVNTLGDVVGTIIAGFVIIPAFGLQRSLQAGILISGLIGASAFLLLSGKHVASKRWGPLCGVVILFSIALIVTPKWRRNVIDSGIFRFRSSTSTFGAGTTTRRTGYRLLFSKDGVENTVAVWQSVTDSNKLQLTVNGKTDASTGPDRYTQSLLGHIPMMLHEAPERVLVVGLGSGMTAGSVLKHPVIRCDIAEISSEVVLASRYFDSVSGAPLLDKRSNLYVCDARELLLLTPQDEYDIVISEPSNPWIAGIGNLFTVEYFQSAAKALAQDGLFVQWLHLYEMDNATLSVALNSLSKVFPHVSIWSPLAVDIILVASKEPLRLDTNKLRERLAFPRVASDLANLWPDAKPLDALCFLSLQITSPEIFSESFPGTGRLNYDRYPYLEYHAPRAFYTGSSADLSGIDQRVKDRNTNTLLVSQYIGNRDLRSEEARKLCTFLETRDGAIDARLKMSLAYMLHAKTLLDDRLDCSPHKNIPAIHSHEFQKWGNLSLLGAEMVWNARKTAEGFPDFDFENYAQFQGRKLVTLTTVFWQPDTNEFATAIANLPVKTEAERKSNETDKRELFRYIGL